MFTVCLLGIVNPVSPDINIQYSVKFITNEIKNLFVYKLQKSFVDVLHKIQLSRWF